MTLENTGNDEGSVKLSLSCPPGFGDCTLDGKASQDYTMSAWKSRTAVL